MALGDYTIADSQDMLLSKSPEPAMTRPPEKIMPRFGSGRQVRFVGRSRKTMAPSVLAGISYSWAAYSNDFVPENSTLRR